MAWIGGPWYDRVSVLWALPTNTDEFTDAEPSLKLSCCHRIGYEEA